MPTHKHVGAEIKILLDAVARDRCGERRPQTAPDLDSFAPRFDFANLESVHYKKERSCHVGPESASAEVGVMQHVPTGPHVMSGKRVARISSFRDGRFSRDDGNAFGSKVNALAGLPERLHGTPLSVQVDPQRRGILVLTDTLQCLKLATTSLR
ncbi:hypothetical protein [Nitrobacter hamburgensis]|uniref:hypothetical protein n=1 Tax=Nitrobacter hamburgensis TaxID=912 RepID=UPI0012ED898F|nr:hypothetical protein [Nitrobacter hamburgensis]